LIKKGGTVIIEAVKTIAPPLGAGIDLVESGKKWYEKGEKMVDKPLKFVADEIKSRTAAKIAGMVDVDGLVDHAGISEGLANSAKVLMEVSIGTSDSQELVEKGIDWGVAKLSSPDKSITPEVIVAENKNPSAGLPEYIFGVGNFVNQAGETLMTLPEGDWDITPRDKHGNTNKEPAVKIEAQKETEVICENDDDKADSLHLALHNFNKISISISSGSSIGGGFNVLNAIDSTYALKWAGKTFSAEFEKTFDTSTPNQSSYNIESIDFEGIISIASYDQLEVTVSGTYIYERYINDILISRRITRIDGIAVPAAFSRKDSYGNMWSYFIINPVYNSELLPSLSTYLDFEYHSTSYYSAGDNAGEFRSEIIYNTIENPLDGYIDIRFGYTDYKVISDY